MAATAKLFKNGRSQAVRLPKEFRFEGKEVEIRRDPATGEVVLSATEETGRAVRRKKPVLREEDASMPDQHTHPPAVTGRMPVPAQRKLSLEELYAVFDQVNFPDDFFKREVHMPRELDMF